MHLDSRRLSYLKFGARGKKKIPGDGGDVFPAEGISSIRTRWGSWGEEKRVTGREGIRGRVK